MDIYTDSGSFDSRNLPDAYAPCFCARCGCRLGWAHEEADAFSGICDECACMIAKDNSEDPMTFDEGDEDDEEGEDDEAME